MEELYSDKVIRYRDCVVTPTLTDRMLALAYLQMEKEGTLPVVYYQGVPTISKFLELHLSKDRIVLGCFRHDPHEAEATAEFCGMGWISNAQAMDGCIKAECGMAFFRAQTSRRDNLLFGKLMLDMFFDRYKIDVIFGTTPEPNLLARRYAQRLGFSMHGPIPDFATWQGKPAPAWISHLSKAEWRERGR